MTTPADPLPLVEQYGPRCAPSPFERGTDGPRVIMVGIDGSDTSMRAAAYACGLARRQQSQLMVVFVAAPSAWTASVTGAGAAMQEALDELAAELRRDIRTVAEELRVPVTFVIRRGDPCLELRRAADEAKADTVVVGSSMQAGHRLIGSIATRLVRLGKWPVVVVP
ncbi:universal stress protein [Hamadaea tsunoensis]|uniref:universal stress protein n=1 Tax=Hamadaea tsunoensis TaxID=53368 RepID=UPI00040D9F76|nr:universal stress protein [Hamadaea tsunoensis]